MNPDCKEEKNCLFRRCHDCFYKNSNGTYKNATKTNEFSEFARKR